MFDSNWIIVKRDIEAITVPFGSKMKLPSGTQVRLTQSFGGSYTVVTDLGIMCRVDAQDADAIGQLDAAAASFAADPNSPYDESKVWEQLRTVYDPEIPINVVDLGLIYGLKSLPLEQGGHRVEIRMTMTAPGCGMGEVIKQDVERKIATVPGVREVHVEIVFEPAWSLDKMSEAARLQLGL
ncbi:MAG: putative Fe-S cluster assembly protein SufT [Terriglobales bacterium]